MTERLYLVLAVLLSSGCQSHDDAEPTETEPAQYHLELNLRDVELYPGEVIQLRASWTRGEGDSIDVTSEATWEVSSEAGTFDAPGLILAIREGYGVIAVTYERERIELPLSVAPFEHGLLSILLDPNGTLIPRDFAVYVDAVGIYEDGQTRIITPVCEWENHAADIISIEEAENERRRIRGIRPGDARVSAQLGTLSVEATFVVTLSGLEEIEIVPGTPGFPVGATQQFTAIGRFHKDELVDVTEMGTWASTNVQALAISDEAGHKGSASALGEGSATITLTVSTGSEDIIGQTLATVTPMHVEQLSTVPALISLPVGSSTRLRSSAVMEGSISLDVTLVSEWTLDDESFATLYFTPDDELRIEALNPGTTTLTLTFGDGILHVPVEVRDAELVEFELFVVNSSLAAGDESQFYAVGTYSDQVHADVSSLVSWSSDTPAVAVVSNAPEPGLAVGVSPGSASITASHGELSQSTVLTVTDAVVQEIQVRPALAAVPIGDTVSYSALGLYTDNSLRVITEEVTWSNANLDVAVISNAEGARGELQTLTGGFSIVTASLGDLEDTGELIVNNIELEYVYLNPSEVVLLPGRWENLLVITMYDNGSTLISTDSAVFTSSNPDVVQVSNEEDTRGRVSAISVGEATISAVVNDTVGERAVTVTPATLVGLVTSEALIRVPAHVSEGVEVWGVFSEEGVVEEEYTQWAVWTSSDENIAVVGNFPLGPGRIKGVSPGVATITAGYGEFEASMEVVVDERLVVSTQIGPPNAILPPDFLQWFATIATFDDDSTLDVTADAPMQTSDNTVFTVLNNDFFSGIVSTVGSGVATLSSEFAGHQAETLVTVRHAEPDDVFLSPVNPTLSDGGTRFLAATGMYPDGSIGDLTELCLWSSSDPFVVLVFDEMFVKGLMIGLNPGTATITALCRGFIATTQVTVI